MSLLKRQKAKSNYLIVSLNVFFSQEKNNFYFLKLKKPKHVKLKYVIKHNRDGFYKMSKKVDIDSLFGCKEKHYKLTHCF